MVGALSNVGLGSHSIRYFVIASPPSKVGAPQYTCSVVLLATFKIGKLPSDDTCHGDVGTPGTCFGGTMGPGVVTRLLPKPNSLRAATRA